MELKETDDYSQMPTYDEAIVYLLKSIVAEEEAFSKLIRTESDKTIAFVGERLDFPTNPSTSEIIQYNQTLVHLLDTVLMSKWLLMKKLDVVIHNRTGEPAVELDTAHKTFETIHDPGIDY